MRIERKNDLIWPIKNFFFIKTMQEYIRELFPWRDFTNYAMNCSPSYSADFAPSDYFLFPNLKKWLGGKRFYSNDEIIS